MWLLLLSIGLAIAGVVGLARKGVPESISGAVWAKAEKLRWIWSWWIACVAGHSVFVAECTCAISLYGCLSCVI